MAATRHTVVITVGTRLRVVFAELGIRSRVRLGLPGHWP